MTAIRVGRIFKTRTSALYGGDGSILVQTNRAGNPESGHRVFALLAPSKQYVLRGFTGDGGQVQFDYLDVATDFIIFAVDSSGATNGAFSGMVTPSTSPTAEVIDFAGTGQAGSNSVTVALTLTDRDGNPQTNLTGLQCVLFDQVTPGTFVAVSGIVTGETTDGSGNLSVTFTTSTKSAGDDAFILVSNTDGDPDNDSDAFAAPVLLS